MSAKYQRDNRTLIWLNREIDSLMRRMFELLNKGEEEQLIELPLDIFETKDALVVIADLPGVTKDNIDIIAHGQWIVLAGKKENTQDDIEGKILYHRIERRFGKFIRKINIPERYELKQNVPHHIAITKEEEEETH
ncbi:MAG: Hsp20/alpha crystallin family protein [Deltaproteobacteria bacterium]|nr:Hsp20/alpha crystallin family protein [Deltaproteobacteria bacterium]